MSCLSARLVSLREQHVARFQAAASASKEAARREFEQRRSPLNADALALLRWRIGGGTFAEQVAS